MSTVSPYERARVYYEHRFEDKGSGKLKYANGPVITISRETGAGANFVCDELAAFFAPHFPENDSPWTIFDKNLIDVIIEEHRLPVKIKSYLSEERFSAMNTVMNELFGVHPAMMTLFHKTAETILHIAQMGYCIIVGRGSNIITKKFERAIHVRLVAPYEHRLAHMQKHYEMDMKTAADFIKKEDVQRTKYVESFLHKNCDAPHYFHFVLNTGILSFKEAAQIIGNYVLAKFPAP
jgi:cytidylate kinase